MVFFEMPRFEPAPWRKELRFAEEVASNFGFLESKYGFHIVKEDITFGRYENQRMFVNVWHGRGSYVVGVEIGLLSKPEYGYSLDGVLNYLGAEGLEGYAAIDKDQVKRRVRQVAELVEQHTGILLNGDPVIFEKLEKRAKEYALSYMRSIELYHIRENGDKAWHEKDYEEVERQYGAMLQSEMTGSEAAKLEYAKKKLGRKW
jgi:hypothetical protein